MNALRPATLLLVLIGALNWGLVGLGMLMGAEMKWNLVNMLLGSMPMLEAVVYLLVGVSAVVEILNYKSMGKK